MYTISDYLKFGAVVLIALFIGFKLLGWGVITETKLQDPVSAVRHLQDNYNSCVIDRTNLENAVGYWKDDGCEKELNNFKRNRIHFGLGIFWMGLTALIVWLLTAIYYTNKYTLKRKKKK